MIDHHQTLVRTKHRPKLEPSRWTLTGDIVVFSAEPDVYAAGPDPDAHRARVEAIPPDHLHSAETDTDTDTDTDGNTGGRSLACTFVAHRGRTDHRPVAAREDGAEAVVVNVVSQGEAELEESVDEPVALPYFSHAHDGRAFPPGPWAHHAEAWPDGGRLADGRDVPPLHLFLLHRFDELLGALRAGALPPVLLATPTLDNGHLDPEVLVDRLEACAAAGVEPLPADLAQALMRLPRGTHPAAAGRAAKVESAAARSAAEWLAGGGMPDPVAGFEWVPMSYAGDRRLRPVLRAAAPTGHRLIDEVLLATPRMRTSGESSYTS